MRPCELIWKPPASIASVVVGGDVPSDHQADGISQAILAGQCDRQGAGAAAPVSNVENAQVVPKNACGLILERGYSLVHGSNGAAANRSGCCAVVFHAVACSRRIGTGCALQVVYTS